MCLHMHMYICMYVIQGNLFRAQRMVCIIDASCIYFLLNFVTCYYCIYFSFIFPAAPKITKHLTDLTQHLYDIIQISCAFNGFPNPSIEWIKNGGETVMNSDRIKISSCPTSSVLEIRDLQYMDEGEYICKVSNELGTDETLMDLYIEGLYMYVCM